MNRLSKGSVSWTEIDESADGQRIDNFLVKTLKGVPRSHVYRILRSGEVRVNSGRVRATYRLEAGDRVRIPPVRVATRAVLRPGKRPVDRAALGQFPLFEDETLLAWRRRTPLPATHSPSALAEEPHPALVGRILAR